MGPQEDYIETVFTCEGDFHDPHLKDRLEDFQKCLKDLLLTDKSKLILKKVEPWNSVRVTFRIPQEAALRLKQLAQQGNATLRELGVLAVQIQDQNISLTIAGRNNEHTQLVFRTAESSKDNIPSFSVYGKHSPSLDEVGPQGLGSTHFETTSKSIVNYLHQGPPALLDLFGQHATGEKILSPQCDGTRMKINNILSEHGSQHKSFQEAATQSGYDHLGKASGLYVNSLNSNRDPIGNGVQKFPQVPGLPPGFSPGLPPGPSKQHALDNLPPPPPYPEGSSYMSNLQKLHLGSTSISPLLKNDPNLSCVLAAGRHAPTLDSDSLQPPKKKRKPRKPRVKKKDELNSATYIPNAGSISDPCADAISMSSYLAPTVTSIMDLKSNHAISDHVFKTVPQAVTHNVETKSEQIVPLSSIATQGRFDEGDTAGKIINPVTGLLEPRENLSDTSPAKSDGGMQSPRPVVQGVTENSFQSPIKEGINVVGYPVRQLHPNQSNQRQNSDHCNHSKLSPGQTMLSSSSQFESSATCDLLHQKHLEEATELEMVRKTQLKNDILPLLSIVEQTLYSASKHSGIVERKCDNNTGTDDLQGTKGKNEKRKEVTMPQEIHTKSIPFQLLNKPLLQVKHDYWTDKPSGSASDRYGESKISTQSLSLDTHNSSDHSGPHTDPKMYNNDSGVGSCSERSDDTPSEPGDSDYKSGNTNSVECTKPSINEPLKQVLPNSNIVSVGYSVKETQMDIKNHKIVAPFLGSDKLLYLSLDKTKFKVGKIATCPTSRTPHSNWTLDEHQGMANNVDQVTQAVHNTSNLNGPKLPTSLPKSVHHGVDGQLNSMQGHTVPLSMQKTKASPRNSPRSFSPRNPSSPRKTCSPRGCSSPRTIDPIFAGPSHQAFLELSAQSFGRESQNKSPFSDQGRSPPSEQRKSPYSMSDPHSPFSSGMFNLLGTHMNSAEAQVDRNHVGMESVTSKQQQCNNDISFLKSLEAARQLNILASTKDANFLPLFQKIQQMNVIHSMTNGVNSFNRNDNVTHTSRSPGPSVPLPKNHEPNTNVMDVHTDGAVHNCMLSGPLSNVHTSSNSDKDNSNHRTNSKGSKLHSEELKGVTNSSSRRSSPGAASNTSSSLHQLFNSTLPQPKRLTESVQKLLTLPLLDTSLPRVNCRSPASSASGTKLISSTTGTQCIANSRESEQAPVLTFSRNPNEDSAHIDLDSITPSITGFGFEPIDFHVDMSHYSYMDINNTEHSCMSSFIENHPVNVSRPSAVSLSPTKLVPVHTGVITSYIAGESLSSLKNGHVTHTSENQNGSNVQIPVASELQADVCNSESKMAVNSALASTTFSSHVCITQVCSPILQPLNVQKHFEQPKNLFQQMGQSEMLQVTAKICSLTGRLSPFVPENALSSEIKKTNADTEKSDLKVASRYVEHLTLNMEPHNHVH